MRCLILVCLLAGLLPAFPSAARTHAKDERTLYHQCFGCNRQARCSQAAFREALQGYRYLDSLGVLSNRHYLTIVDFTKSKRTNRLFVLDMLAGKLVISSSVTHGSGSVNDSGDLVPFRFSNDSGTRRSSIGFMMTADDTTLSEKPRNGDRVLLQLSGLEKNYNDSACRRDIVIHYGCCTAVGNEEYVTATNAGRSDGCFALPRKYNDSIIALIKGGSLLFAYSDKVRHYTANSDVLQRRIDWQAVRANGSHCKCSALDKAANNR